MGSRICDLVSAVDAPYQFGLDNADGDVVAGANEYPDLEVRSVTNSEVERLVWQTVDVEPLEQGADQLIVGRLVAVLAGGGEVEVGERVVVPKLLVEQGIDTSVCSACRRPIRDGDYVIVEGVACHPECVEYDDDEEQGEIDDDVR